jgi:quinol monooxygenase YgiN
MPAFAGAVGCGDERVVQAAEDRLELFIFARFHAREGNEDAVAAALRDVVGPTRAEPGCRAIAVYRSIHDPRLFYIHSCWINEAAFDTHAILPHTVWFLERVQPLLDHPLEVARTVADRISLDHGITG